MIRITRLEVIDENGRSYVNWEDDNNVSWQFQDDGRTLKVFVNKVEPKTPVEEAYKRWWGDYPPTTPSVSNFDDNMWSAFQKGYTSAKEDCEVGEFQPKEKEQKWDVIRESVKWCEEHRDESVEDYLKPHTPEQVDAGLRNAMRQAKKDGVFDEPTKPMNEVLDRLENKYKDAEENAASYITDDVVNRMLKEWEENPPDFLKFELGKTLEGLIEEWWCDVFTRNSDLSMEESIDCLVSMISNWLPKSQSHEGTQSASVIDLVDGYNDALTKIKSKLRNKK
jgi:hypothetical protein